MHHLIGIGEVLKLFRRQFPGVSASELLAPYDMSAINPLNPFWCNSLRWRSYRCLPNCEITNNTRDTQFSQLPYLELTIMDLLNGGLQILYQEIPLVPSPGIINTSTGVVNWNVGWWGQFNIEVRPISCNGDSG